MKKNYLKGIGSFLCASLIFASCQKESLDAIGANSVSGSSASAKENSCRMTVNDWSTVAKWEFYYNENGLADKWIVDYGYGLPLHTNEMTYDSEGRLIQSDEVYFGANYVYHFYYTGKRLTRITRVNVDNPADVGDFVFTYNNKGQVVRQDDIAFDVHAEMTYDNMGNCTRTDLYFGEELYFSDNYTFNTPARNPRNAIPGVEIGFPFYGTGGFGDKWWFTSNRTEIYSGGDVSLYNDYDPEQTTITMGNHNYPSAATYFDRVTSSQITIGFDYENCNGTIGKSNSLNAQGKTSTGGNRTLSNARPLLRWGSSDSVKEQLKRLKDAKAKFGTMQ